MKKFNNKILGSLVFLFVFAILGSVALFAAGPATVNLGTAGNFAILSKAAITNVPTSVISGNVGVSPITGASIGLTCAEVTGIIYSVDAAGPMPCRVVDSVLLTAAIGHMEAAYTDAATRTPAVGANLNIGGGTVSTQTFVPGLYTWTTNVAITGDITLSGDETDIWIFQVNGTLDLDAGVDIILSGGALPDNVFWQTTQTVNLMAGSHFEGNILSQTDIAMRNGATLNGRALAQTEVTLIANTVSIPVVAPSPLPATLNIIKTVINNDEGEKTASDFTINVTGTNVSSTSFLGEENPGTVVTLDAGIYSIDEVADSGYVKTLSADCSGTIAEGESKTCIITNNDVSVLVDDDVRVSTGGTVIGSMPGITGGNTTVTTTTVTNIPTTSVTTSVIVPSFPVTGFSPKIEKNLWDRIVSFMTISWFK